MNKSVGFVGGGRIARVLLGGFRRCGKLPSQLVVSDVHPEPLEKLKSLVPEVRTVVNNNKEAAAADIVFLAVHPPAIASTAHQIQSVLKNEAILISLAPKVTMAQLKGMLEGFDRLARMIPNACSIVNSGYNPICFSRAVSEGEKQDLLNWLSAVGECPEVAEEKLEAYAILTGMGPTYFWFQWIQLLELAKSFGLTGEEAMEGLKRMLIGAAQTLAESGLSPQEVMDLIPVKPLADEEPHISAAYQQRLPALYQRLKP